MTIPEFQNTLVIARAKVIAEKKKMDMNKTSSIDTARIWDIVLKELGKNKEESE